MQRVDMQRGSAARKFLTEPSEGVGNQGWDNKNSDLIIAVEDVFCSKNGHRYVVKELLGQGTFGQVVKCHCEEAGESLAVKVIKNQDAFFQQARVEVGVLQYLNKVVDSDDKHHIVRMLDCFLWRKHLCLVFELLSVNLYELLKHNHFKGLSLGLLAIFTAQILECLAILRDHSIIHCDLKPENVLLQSLESGGIKVIDFGSACFETKTAYSYIQSRFYRSPEVLLGHPYNVAIDMWSLGCMAAELFLGLPLFPGASEHDLLIRITETLGLPPESLLRASQHTYKFFRRPDEAAAGGSSSRPGGAVARYQIRSQADFESTNGQLAPAGKRYFQTTKLADIICTYPHKPGLTDEKFAEENRRRDSFLDFLTGVLDLDPVTRWSPRQALQHPFIKGYGPLPFQPQPDPHLPQNTAYLHPGSAPSNSPYGAPASPYAAGMMATSPEAHAQAHAAAMAAISAHFSPRQGGGFMANPNPSIRGSTGQGPDLPSTSYSSQPYGSATASRRGGIPTPPGSMHTNPYPINTNTPPGRSHHMGIHDVGGWGQMSPAQGGFAPGGIPLSPMASGSYLRSGSLAKVLAPWNQQGGGTASNLPVGSLEALRGTWRAPHNSYNHGGGYNNMRAARTGSGNLGSQFPGQSVEKGLPPLPMPSSSLQGDGPGEAQRGTSSERMSFEANAASEQGRTPSWFLDSQRGGGGATAQAALQGTNGRGGEAHLYPTAGIYPTSATAQQSWRDTFILQGSNTQAPSAFQQGYTGGPYPTSANTQPSANRGGGSADSAVAMLSRGNSGGWPTQDPQRRGLARGTSGDGALAEPSDWDPLYSDDQLLSEEAGWRSGGAAAAEVVQQSNYGGQSRPTSGSHPLQEPQADALLRAAGYSQGAPGSPSGYGQPILWPQSSRASQDTLPDLHQARQQGLGILAEGGLRDDAQGASASPYGVDRQEGVGNTGSIGHTHGNFPGGLDTWQHPALSASLYTLPEAGAYQEPSGLSTNNSLPVFAPAGLKGAQA